MVTYLSIGKIHFEHLRETKDLFGAGVTGTKEVKFKLIELLTEQCFHIHTKCLGSQWIAQSAVDQGKEE